MKTEMKILQNKFVFIYKTISLNTNENSCSFKRIMISRDDEASSLRKLNYSKSEPSNDNVITKIGANEIFTLFAAYTIRIFFNLTGFDNIAC